MFGSRYFSAWILEAEIFDSTGAGNSGTPDHLRGAIWAVPFFGGYIKSRAYFGGEISARKFFGGQIRVN